MFRLFQLRRHKCVSLLYMLLVQELFQSKCSLYMILFEDRKPSEVVRYLMSRPIKKEKIK